MKIYVTKYALTKGILVFNDATREINPGSGDNEVCPQNTIFVDEQGISAAFVKPDWHETETDAINYAKDMARKKIISLKRQIEKIETVVCKLDEAELDRIDYENAIMS